MVPGKVIAMNDDKTYDILYDDGDDELNVKPSLMKREGEPILVWTRRSREGHDRSRRDRARPRVMVKSQREKKNLTSSRSSTTY